LGRDRKAGRHRAGAGGPLDRLTVRLCSQNPNKLRELSLLLPEWELELLGVDGYPREGSDSYYENARAKARYGHQVAPEARTLGEDSGLEVEALGGAPGIRSARYAPAGGEAIAKLLDELRGVESGARLARYVCELVLIGPDGQELRGAGTLEGRIAEEPRGTEGFGYDPVFIPEGEEQTVAELGNDWKSRNSHRARAAAALRGQAR
jgi:XTP/dITP diphosphohydrolase